MRRPFKFEGKGEVRGQSGKVRNSVRQSPQFVRESGEEIGLGRLEERSCCAVNCALDFEIGEWFCSAFLMEEVKQIFTNAAGKDG